MRVAVATAAFGVGGARSRALAISAVTFFALAKRAQASFRLVAAPRAARAFSRDKPRRAPHSRRNRDRRRSPACNSARRPPKNNKPHNQHRSAPDILRAHPARCLPRTASPTLHPAPLHPAPQFHRRFRCSPSCRLQRSTLSSNLRTPGPPAAHHQRRRPNASTPRRTLARPQRPSGSALLLYGVAEVRDLRRGHNVDGL